MSASTCRFTRSYRIRTKIWKNINISFTSQRFGAGRRWHWRRYQRKKVFIAMVLMDEWLNKMAGGGVGRKEGEKDGDEKGS